MEELKRALETAKEQQAAKEEAWRAAVEEGKIERTVQVNKLIEKVKEMEIKQSEIRQNMEEKLKNIREQPQEKLMQKEYKRKLEQEIQRYISTQTSTCGMEPAQMEKFENEKITSHRKALETAKQMLHQTRGECKSPEMDWDYYWVHASE